MKRSVFGLIVLTVIVILCILLSGCSKEPLGYEIIIHGTCPTTKHYIFVDGHNKGYADTKTTLTFKLDEREYKFEAKQKVNGIYYTFATKNINIVSKTHLNSNLQ